MQYLLLIYSNEKEMAALNPAEGTVTPLTGQGSHQIATLGRANALITVPEWVVQMHEGDSVEVLCLP